MVAVSSVDKTLEIVKDAEKFKQRIAELAKAEAASNGASAVEKATNQRLFAERDASLTKYNEELAAVRASIKSEAKGLEPDKDAILAGFAEIAKQEAYLAKAQSKLDEESSNFAKRIEDYREERDEFTEKARVFDATVKAAFGKL